nr:TetR/AcrR family transcriptional regulator [Kineosporia babensis]
MATAFRLHGYEGASLAAITRHTGLGKGSLYNFFPGGKEEMANAVLDEVGLWFETHVYRSLQNQDVPAAERLTSMAGAVEEYFSSRHLVCLYGSFALGQERERFAQQIAGYFTAWIQAITEALPGPAQEAEALATDFVATVQGALILARALDDPPVLHSTVARSLRHLTSLAGPDKAR